MMRVLGLLISSSLSSGRISCDNSSRRRRLQICGQFLCTTARKAWSRTMLAAQPISASWSLQNNFYVYAMFEKQWLLVPANSLQCSCSQLARQSLPSALIIWSQPNSLDADRGKIWSTQTHATLRCFLLSPSLSASEFTWENALPSLVQAAASSDSSFMELRVLKFRVQKSQLFIKHTHTHRGIRNNWQDEFKYLFKKVICSKIANIWKVISSHYQHCCF